MSMEIKHDLLNDVWVVTYEGKETGWEIKGDRRGFLLTSEVSYQFRCLIAMVPGSMGYEMDIVIMFSEKDMPNRTVTFESNVQKYGKDISEKINEFLVPRKTFTMEEINRIGGTKSYFLDILEFSERFDSYDTALPQNWLDRFADYAIRCDNRITYYFILSTTVWAYGKEAGAFGRPVSFCYEINRLLKRYDS